MSPPFSYFKVKRRTSRKKYGQALREFCDWVHGSRNLLKKGEMLRRGKAKVAGHLSYYAITDNSGKCVSFVYHATRILFKWMNRKSQRKTYTWEGYNQALNWVEWPRANIRKDLNPFRGVWANWTINWRAGCTRKTLVRFCEGLGGNREVGSCLVYSTKIFFFGCGEAGL